MLRIWRNIEAYLEDRSMLRIVCWIQACANKSFRSDIVDNIDALLRHTYAYMLYVLYHFDICKQKYIYLNSNKHIKTQ